MMILSHQCRCWTGEGRVCIMANFSFTLHRSAFEQVTYLSSSLTVPQSARYFMSAEGPTYYNATLSNQGQYRQISVQ